MWNPIVSHKRLCKFRAIGLSENMQHKAKADYKLRSRWICLKYYTIIKINEDGKSELMCQNSPVQAIEMQDKNLIGRTPCIE